MLWIIGNKPGSGGALSPGGSTGQIQFNNAGAFDATSRMFWDSANRRVIFGASTTGIATVVGSFNFVRDEASVGSGNFINYGGAMQINLYRAGGTAGAPTAVNSGQTIASFFAGGYNGTNWNSGNAGINAVANQNWTGATRATILSFVVTPDSTLTGVARAELTGTAFTPASNDGTALGTTTKSWSDLFLASGGVINFNNGDLTLTHSAGVLTSSGRLVVSADSGSNPGVSVGGGTNVDNFISLSGGRVMLGHLVSSGSGELNSGAGKGFIIRVNGTSGTLGSGTVAINCLSTGFTNVKLAPRIQTVASSATVTPSYDSNDFVDITAQAVGLTIANPTGTPANGQRITIRVKDDGGAQTIAFGADYRAFGVALPVSTTAGKVTYIQCVYNSNASKLDVIDVTTEI